jgi:hypothetical protein
LRPCSNPFTLSAIVLAACVMLTASSGHSEAGINFLALIFALFHRPASGTDLIGKELSFFKYRCDNSLGLIFPIKGKVLKTVTLSGEEDWLLVKLNQVFDYQGMSIEYVLIRRNDKKTLVPGKENQLVFFKLVPDPDKICDKENDKADFPFEVWALCK